MRSFLAGSLLLISLAGFGQARRALSLIEKHKYETAFDLLKNTLAKDSISASVPFALANLYLVPQWPQNQLDSAYYFAVLSLSNYAQLDEKRLDRHIKEGFGKTRLLSLKIHIDSLAFGVAKNGDTQNDYQEFINKHTDALALDSAIYYRDKQAFLTASHINTLASYKHFLDSYPQAVDWAKADAQYQQILYNKSTIRGKLWEYQSFVKSYPKSPYYEQAVHHIYTILAGQNTSKALLPFIEGYPNSQAAQKAIGVLYHTHITQESSVSFADKYPTITLSDSLRQVIKSQDKTLIPYWNGFSFQLIDLAQNIIIDSLILVNEQSIDKDFIIAETRHGAALLGKNGRAFYRNKAFIYVSEQQGYIFIRAKGELVLVHKNGSLINAGDAAYWAGSFVAYKVADKWGLKSITNLPVLPPKYDSIWAENGLLFLLVKEKKQLLKPAQLYPALDGEKVNLPPFVDDYEWLTDSLLWIEESGKESLFSESLEELVPIGSHQIDMTNKGWMVKEKKEIRVPAFSNQVLVKFIENDKWQMGWLKDSLIIKYEYNKTFHPIDAFLVGSSAIIMQFADTSYMYLSDSVRVFKTKNCEVKPLLSSSNKVYYYEITKGKEKTIVTALGQKLELPKFSKLIPLNQSFFQLKTSKAKQLYSSTGQLLLTNIDGASLINDSTLSILKDQKFGVLQPFDTLVETGKPIFIAPTFTQKLAPLNDSLWVVSVGAQQGLIKTTGDTLLPFNYDEINPWVNGLLFLKKDLKWDLYDLKASKFVEFGIVSFTSITKEGSPKITYQKGVGIGVFDSKKGVVLKPTYSTISLKGSSTQPYYRAEKHVEEAGLHIMLYYNLDGALLFQNILDEEAYGLLFNKKE
ncbi:MAG: WG repeat-containing protein [Cyclobacteriaceae bacterium]|nr:WG repeat-containing protein [Cyclobacteriaceae bacterium]